MSATTAATNNQQILQSLTQRVAAIVVRSFELVNKVSLLGLPFCKNVRNAMQECYVGTCYPVNSTI